MFLQLPIRTRISIYFILVLTIVGCSSETDNASETEPVSSDVTLLNTFWRLDTRVLVTGDVEETSYTNAITLQLIEGTEIVNGSINCQGALGYNADQTRLITVDIPGATEACVYAESEAAGFLRDISDLRASLLTGVVFSLDERSLTLIAQSGDSYYFVPIE